MALRISGGAGLAKDAKVAKKGISRLFLSVNLSELCERKNVLTEATEAHRGEVGFRPDCLGRSFAKVFHSMENFFVIFPHNGRNVSTLWKTFWGGA